jgi:hypothetical protein
MTGAALVWSARTEPSEDDRGVAGEATLRCQATSAAARAVGQVSVDDRPIVGVEAVDVALRPMASWSVCSTPTGGPDAAANFWSWRHPDREPAPKSRSQHPIGLVHEAVDSQGPTSL